MKDSRWLFITPYYKPAHVYGGPTYSIPTLCETMASMGAKITVFTTNANGQQNLTIPPDVLQEIDGVQIYYFRRDMPGSYFFSSSLGAACYERIHRSIFDVVYVASNWGYPFQPACRASFKAKVPFIVSPRASFKQTTWKGKYIKKLGYHVLLERYLIQRASLLHYTTELESRDSHWLRLRPPEATIPNPVRLLEFQSLPTKGSFRNRFDISADDKIILILGRIDPDKGIDLALQAFVKVIERIPDARLVIAGPEENNYIQKLLSWAGGLGIAKQILFTGLLNSSQKLQAFADADLLLSPSRSENFGMSIVEAMACNLPVVVSDQVGVAETISRNQAGVVVPLDAEEMANAIVNILKNPSLREKYGCRGKQMVREHFSPEAIAQKFLQLV